jgi:hypothetical protein
MSGERIAPNFKKATTLKFLLTRGIKFELLSPCISVQERITVEN